VFPPGGVLETLPATYITSFYLPSGDKQLLVDMVRQFPAVTVLELDLIMAEVGRIFRQVTLAVEYVLLFVLLAGFAVLFAALQNSLDERLYEGALLRALGASCVPVTWLSIRRWGWLPAWSPPWARNVWPGCSTAR
jgi:putative ABC transport system permease protein